MHSHFLPHCIISLRPARFLVLIILLTSTIYSFVEAQILPAIPVSPKAIRDSKGRDFWIAFPRNHHDAGSSFDRLYLNIISERPSQGKIEYINTAGQLVQVSFFLTANDVYSYDIPFGILELGSPQISKTAIHITTDEEVTVYGLSVASTTSDAFLAFPTDVLGREYVIASYPSNLLYNNTGRIINTATSTMTQFAVLAVEDSTLVSITPTAKTWNGDSTSYTLRLNKGEVQLISMYPTAENALKDFTGTRISSTKRLVVYGGHERAAIPVGAGSRDCLIEQMLPVEVWGKTALVVPYPYPGRNGAPDYGIDLVRVIAGYDSTVVFVNNSTVATLKAGGFYEMQITTEASIVTSEPAVVMGYKASARNANAQVGGDPFLASIPPVEQFLSRYRFVCVQGTQLAQGSPNRTEPAFQEHYVTIIVPTTKATTVVLNNGALSASAFKPIIGSGYSYTSVPVAQGIHSISADTTFGITVAGYGRANSYGYIGGQRFETDIRSPQIVVRRTCTGIQGVAFDSAFTDSKIFFYDTLRGTQRNIRFSFNNLPRPADSLGFQADLFNIYEDGSLGLVVVDSLDLRTVQRVIVPGFTVHLDPKIRTNAVVSTSAIMRVATGRDYCFRLNVSNYGGTNQTVQQVGFSQQLPQFFARNSRAVRIEPSSQGTIEYCFRTDVDGTFVDTLTISNGCITRPILAIRIEAGQDKNPPSLARSVDSCNRTIVIQASDSRTFDAGLERVDVVAQNLTVRQEFVPVASPLADSAKRPIRVIMRVTDPRRDAVYALTARDSVGNVVTLRDTIPGFTLRFVAASDTSAGRFTALPLPNTNPSSNILPAPPVTVGEYRFSPVTATALRCGTITVQNVGIMPFVLDYAPLFRNVQFSIPPSQFPIFIPAGGERLLTVCFSPSLIASYNDTLIVSKYCITDQIAIIGEGKLTEQLVGTRCNAVLQVTPIIGSSSNQGFAIAPTTNTPSQIVQTNASNLDIKHFPDPAQDNITLRLKLNTLQILSIRIVSMMGVEIASLPKQVIERGEWDLRLQLDNVETGTYLCEVRSEAGDGQRWSKMIRIVK